MLRKCKNMVKIFLNPVKCPKCKKTAEKAFLDANWCCQDCLNKSSKSQ